MERNRKKIPKKLRFEWSCYRCKAKGTENSETDAYLSATLHRVDECKGVGDVLFTISTTYGYGDL